jgi:hypothetical protein
MSRIFETLAILGEIFTKTTNHKFTIFDHCKDDVYSVGHHRGGQIIAAHAFFPLVSALDAARTPVFRTLLLLLPRQLPAVKIAVVNNLRKRALCATVLYWPASPTADRTARVKRDVATRSETFRVKTILARPRLSTRILDSCATLVSWGIKSKKRLKMASARL